MQVERIFFLHVCFCFNILNDLHFYLLLLLTIVTGAKLGANTDD